MTGWRFWFSGRFESEVRPSIEKRIEAGAVLFRAGDRCHAVALVRAGEIELLADRDGHPVRVATRGRGSFVGDDEALGDGVWHRTARALRRSRVEMLPRDVYIERYAACPADAVTPAPTGAVARLLPASPESAAALPAAGIDITDLPFTIGRAPGERDATIPRQNAFLLRERRPYRLSRCQFVVVALPDGIGLSDPGSRLGTFIDGRRLGPDPLPLQAHESVDIEAGGRHSPFRFKLGIG